MVTALALFLLLQRQTRSFLCAMSNNCHTGPLRQRQKELRSVLLAARTSAGGQAGVLNEEGISSALCAIRGLRRCQLFSCPDRLQTSLRQRPLGRATALR